MRTISQGELRDNVAEVLRGVERGYTYTVTSGGQPVAQLSPVLADTDLRCVRPAIRRSPRADLQRVRLPTTTEIGLADGRSGR